MAAIKKIDHVLASFSKILCFIGGIIILFQMGLIVVDVCMRTFMHSTVVGASIIARNSLIASVFPGLPYVTFTNTHTRVEVFYTNAGPKRKWVMDIITQIFGVIIFALMSYSLVGPVQNAIATAQYDVEGTLLLPLAPFYICTLFGAVFSLYAAIRRLILTIVEGTRQYEMEG